MSKRQGRGARALGIASVFSASIALSSAAPSLGGAVPAGGGGGGAPASGSGGSSGQGPSAAYASLKSNLQRQIQKLQNKIAVQVGEDRAVEHDRYGDPSAGQLIRRNAAAIQNERTAIAKLEGVLARLSKLESAGAAIPPEYSSMASGGRPSPSGSRAARGRSAEPTVDPARLYGTLSNDLPPAQIVHLAAPEPRMSDGFYKPSSALIRPTRTGSAASGGGGNSSRGSKAAAQRPPTIAQTTGAAAGMRGQPVGKNSSASGNSKNARQKPLPWSSPGFGCNSVAFWQIPGRKNLFLGRVYLGDSQCGGSPWGLALGEMNWKSHEISIQKRVLSVPARVLFGETITTAYDPSVEYFNGEYWAAFECGGNIPGAGTASTCMGPLDLQKGAIDLSRTYVAVRGAVTGPYLYSASVPKLLNFKNRLYLYWSSVAMDAGGGHAWRHITSRGTELFPVGGLLWPASVVGGINAGDPTASTEVWGLGTDGRSNGVADMSEAFTDGRYVYALAGLGGRARACLLDESDANGCYRLAIAQSASPLGLHVFSSHIIPAGDALPPNPQSYGRLIQPPDGTAALMGTFFVRSRPTKPGFLNAGSWIIPIQPPLQRIAQGAGAAWRARQAPIDSPTASDPDFLVFLYRNLLGRKPDSKGLKDWLAAMSRGWTRVQVAAAFLGSPEYRNKQNAAYIDFLYRLLLGRAPDSGGFKRWMSAMGRGWTRAQVRAGFLNSSEYRNKRSG